jgi:hypothetical protein
LCYLRISVYNPLDVVKTEYEYILKFLRLFSVSTKSMELYAYMLEGLGIEMGIIVRVDGKIFLNFLRSVRH